MPLPSEASPTAQETPSASIAAMRKTTLEWPEGKVQSDTRGRLLHVDQLARGVVDRGDVVGVEGVLDAKDVGRDGHAHAEDG